MRDDAAHALQEAWDGSRQSLRSFCELDEHLKRWRAAERRITPRLRASVSRFEVTASLFPSRLSLATKCTGRMARRSTLFPFFSSRYRFWS
jgi:hypothetical protein